MIFLYNNVIYYSKHKSHKNSYFFSHWSWLLPRKSQRSPNRNSSTGHESSLLSCWPGLSKRWSCCPFFGCTPDVEDTMLLLKTTCTWKRGLIFSWAGTDQNSPSLTISLYTRRCHVSLQRNKKDNRTTMMSMNHNHKQHGTLTLNVQSDTHSLALANSYLVGLKTCSTRLKLWLVLET